MPSRCTKKKLNELQLRFDELQRQTQQLQSTHSAVCRRVVLLEALCESFAVYKARTIEVAFDGSSCPEGFDELLQHEQLLLSELQELQSGTRSPLDLPQLGISTIAPRNDPLVLFRHHLGHASREYAKTLTALEIAAFYGSTVLQASLQLHLLQSPSPEVVASSEARLKELWEGYMPIPSSILLAGRPIVLEQFSLYNVGTLQPDPEAGPKHAALVATLPPVLGLTDQQLQEVCAGTTLLNGILGNILREQRQHQCELSSSTHGAGSSSDACDSSSMDYTDSSHPHGHRDLAGHQRSTGRMQALLRKEYCMRCAASAWLVGCLTWQQLTKAAVMCWPYPLRTVKLALEISRYAQERSSSMSS